MKPTSLNLKSFFRTVLVCTAVAALPTSASAQECAQPVSSGQTPVASDCLFILGAGIGAQVCSPACICAPSGSLPPKATDALLCLAFVTGQPVMLDCPCDDEPPPPPPPPGSEDYVGFVSASFDRSIAPPIFPIPGVPPTITESYDISGVFGTLEQPGNPQVDVSTETVNGCQVITTELSNTFDQNDLPSFNGLDPGSPGTADNGSNQIDLPRMTVQGAGEFFAPNGDPASQGFGPDQNMMYSWPGGDDINSFNGSAMVPAAINLTMPDLTDSAFDVTPGSPINFAWTPDPDQDGELDVTVTTSSTEFTQGSGDNVTIESTTVVATCSFTDSAGSGTMSGSVTSKLLPSASLPAIYAKTLSADRAYLTAVPVSGSGVGSKAKVLISGTSSVSRVFGSAFPFP